MTESIHDTFHIQMTISVVIPLYNKADSIASTIESVLGQEYQDFEVIVVDDGSTDGSRNVAESFRDPRLRCFAIANSGPSAARNEGVSRAASDRIVFLDADDKLLPEALGLFAAAARSHPDAEVIVANHILEQDGRRRHYSDAVKDGFVGNCYKEWFCGRLMPCAGTVMCRKELLLRHPYDVNLRRYEDLEFAFHAFDECRVFRIGAPTMVYRRDYSSASGKTGADVDFLGHLSVPRSGFWKRVSVYRLIVEAENLYPETASKYRKYRKLMTAPFLRLEYSLAVRLRKRL